MPRANDIEPTEITLPVNGKGLLSTAQVAKLLGVSGETIRTWARDGLMPKPVRPGIRCLRWRAVDLDRWLEQGCVPPTPEGEQRLAEAKEADARRRATRGAKEEARRQRVRQILNDLDADLAEDGPWEPATEEEMETL